MVISSHRNRWPGARRRALVEAQEDLFLDCTNDPLPVPLPFPLEIVDTLRKSLV